ncbi:Angiotensin-converting enzyme [Popillia japonica]|uniref:Angiotensin-converting enzyme n=1 Tax=Popillia japonica TaxID=7064 RepID=A0AAW1KHE0_POPJA
MFSARYRKVTFTVLLTFDEELKRQVMFLRVLGDAALDEESLSELTAAVSSMSSIYNTAKVRPYEKQQCDLDTEGLR